MTLGTSQVLGRAVPADTGPVARTVGCLRDNAEAQRCKSSSQGSRGGSSPPPGSAVSPWIVSPQIHMRPGHVTVFGNEVAADVIR